MFKTELNCEEENILIQMLDGEAKKRNDILLEINYCNKNTEEPEFKNILKNLFNKIKDTSDYEFDEYIRLLLEKN